MTGGRRAATCVLLAALAAALLAAPAPGAGGPERLLVAGDEWGLVLSRANINDRRALIQFLNRGDDDHDLRLRRISRSDASVRPIARWRLTAPGEVSSLTLRLRTGRYRLWCSLPGHRKLGMRATLRVSARG